MSAQTTGARFHHSGLRWSLLILLLIALGALSLRIFAGPIPGLISARTTLNFSAMAFLALIAIACLDGRSQESESLQTWWWLGGAALAVIVATTFLAYLPSIPAPFLFDDYTHLTTAGREALGALLHRVLLEHPSGGDLFFRPAGSLYYWLFFRVAGVNPVPWHLANTTLHVANTLLVYLLARRLTIPTSPALLGAAFFAWTGVHVEDVCWVAAVFDLLATFFVLLALLECLRPRWSATVGMACCCALACLSKESAYSLPLLTLCVGLFRTGADRIRIFRKVIPAVVACGGVFAYRLWYLRGLGGYHNASGRSQALSLHLVSTLQALFLRIWAIFFLPVNWSVRAEFWLQVGTAAMLICIGSLAFVVRRTTAGPAILFVMCAALPVVPLLLIGPDLSGARVLYLPSVGISLVWMQMWTAGNVRVMGIVACGVLLFQLASLWHNETIWVHVAKTASHACLDTANLLKQNPGKRIVASDLPKTLDGVFFLQNGFQQCVAINGGIDASRISSAAPAEGQGPEALQIYWDARTEQLQPH